MEMLELNSTNQTTVNSNGTFNIIPGQQSQQASQQINLGPAHLYRNHQQQQQQHPQGLRYMNNPNVPKHRELPVDVPDSFVGIAKQSPRYPPPKPHRQVSPSMQINNLTTFNNNNNNNNAPNSSMPYNSNNSNANNPSNSQQNQTPAGPPIAQSTAANIMTHNSSLRSSIKLKQLEKSRGNQQYGNYPVGQMQPAINQAFELNEDAVPNQKHQQQSHQQHQSQLQHQQQALKVKQSMPDLCSIYNRLQRNLNGDFAEATGDAKFVKLLSIYNTIVQTHNKQFRIPNLTSRYATRINAHGQHEPATYKVSDLLQSVRFRLREEDMTSDLVELLSLLCKHEVDGVCSAFDRIAQSFEFAKSSSSPSAATTSSPTSDLVSNDNATMQQQQQQGQYPPTNQHHHHHQQQQQHRDIHTYPYQPHQMDDYDYAQDQIQMDIENNLYQNSLHPLTEIDLNDGTCKRVSIQKNSNQALGATIKNEDGGSVIIGRIICGGVAESSGVLNEGDEILEVNGVQMRGKNINEVIEILNSMEDTLQFTIISRNYKPVHRPREDKVFVKTFFKYDGEKDRYIPCKELSLSFEQGEILEIIDRTDPRWWQARREGGSEWLLASLIPSLNFLKEREKESDHEEFANAYMKQREKKTLVSKLFNCPKGSSPRRRKKLPNTPFGPQEITYYEEVSTYYPDKLRKRPIILVGPKMIGQREIWTKLLKDTNRFSSAVSHTSRPIQPHEENGVDFHFVSRNQFEADIKDGKFIEYGQYQNQYYGTSLEAIRTIVKSKKVSRFRAFHSSQTPFDHPQHTDNMNLTIPTQTDLRSISQHAINI